MQRYEKLSLLPNVFGPFADIICNRLKITWLFFIAMDRHRGNHIDIISRQFRAGLFWDYSNHTKKAGDVMPAFSISLALRKILFCHNTHIAELVDPLFDKGIAIFSGQLCQVS